jgi:hypothetical protein
MGLESSLSTTGGPSTSAAALASGNPLGAYSKRQSESYPAKCHSVKMPAQRCVRCPSNDFT